MIFSRFRWLLASALALIAALLWWFMNSRSEIRQSGQSRTRSLESYRREFARPDGTLPNDNDLRNILQAKGIPYVENPGCAFGQNCVPKDSGRVAPHLPEIEYRTGDISAAQRDMLFAAISSTLQSALSHLQSRAENLRLERIVVDQTKKIQLYFSQEFSEIASDESLLNSFSESLHELGPVGLRGATIFIAGKPLGEFMRSLDLQRNREARDNSADSAEIDR